MVDDYGICVMRRRAWWPVRFTHGPDGYLRGLPGSLRDAQIRKRSYWLEIVGAVYDRYTGRRIGYMPLTQSLTDA